MNKNNSALVIIDMQNEFCLEEDGSIKGCYKPIVENINTLSKRFRDKNCPVIWLNWAVENDLSGISKQQKEKFNNFEYPDSLAWKRDKNSFKKALEKGSWSAEVISDLIQVDTDKFVAKQRISGFWSSKLEDVLKKLNIENLFFCGVNTDQCVMSTLQDAHFLGYRCYLVQNCSATSSPDYCSKAALYNIEHCFGEVIDSRDILTDQ